MQPNDNEPSTEHTEPSAEHSEPSPEEAAMGAQSTGLDRVFLLVGVVVFMIFAVLDQTAVGTAMPRIVASLGGIEHYPWVFTAFMLASTVTLPIYATLSDMYGRRHLFLSGAGIFLVGSLLAGSSTSMLMLVLCRGLQGIGAGALLALTPAIVGDVFPPAQRAKWHGLIAAVVGIFVLLGPTLGGAITDYWGWRWIFYVNLPVGLVGLLLCWRTLPAPRERSQQPVDFIGGFLFIVTLVSLLLALSWGGTKYGWTSVPILALFGTATVGFVFLFMAEQRAEKPVLDFGLFRNRMYFVSIVSVLLLAIALYGGTMYIPLFVQGVIGESATSSGVVLTPMLAAFIVSAIISTQTLSRTGRYRILVVCMFGVGATGMLLLARMGSGASMNDVMINMFIAGLGMGGLTTVFTIIVQNALPHERLGEGTGGVQFFRNVGGLMGIAVLGAVVANGYGRAIRESLPAELAGLLSEQQIKAVSNGMLSGGESRMPVLSGLPSEQAEAFIAAIRESLSASIGLAFYASAGALLLGLLVAAFVRDIPLRSTHVQKTAASS